MTSFYSGQPLVGVRQGFFSISQAGKQKPRAINREMMAWRLISGELGVREESSKCFLYKGRGKHCQQTQNETVRAGARGVCHERYLYWMSLAFNKFLFLFSAVSVIQSIPIFNETGRFSFTLPYPVKIKVRFSFFLQIYLIMLFLGKYWLYNTDLFLSLLGGQSEMIQNFKSLFEFCF